MIHENYVGCAKRSAAHHSILNGAPRFAWHTLQLLFHFVLFMFFERRRPMIKDLDVDLENAADGVGK